MFTVVIPLYNKQFQILKTINSVLCQTLQDLEIIVVDDGSTDDSVSKVKGVRDERIRIVQQKNGGPSKARNTGVENANGDWILFLDADDELLPDALETFSGLISEYPSEKCFACNFYIFDTNNTRLLYSLFYYKKVIKNPFWAWSFNLLCPRAGSFLLHKDMCISYKYNNSLRRYEDAEWIFRIMRKESIVWCPKPVMIYNLFCAEASERRKDISEDYLGHLNFLTASVGEKFAVFQLYKQAVALYPHDIERLYTVKWRKREKYAFEILNNIAIILFKSCITIQKICGIYKNRIILCII